jgi:recombination protein RecR
MKAYPPKVEALLAALRRLPSVGPRSAERMALFLLDEDRSPGDALRQALEEALQGVGFCQACGFFSEGPLCIICQDPMRDRSLLCVVARRQDVLRLEQSGRYRGLYHVLGRRLAPLQGIGPEELPVDPLLARIEKERPAEVILALGSDAEGHTTALYLAPLLKKKGVRATILAVGLPAGTGLEYADSVTLGYAFSGRQEI